jgi:NAD(P)-dependent dehydrogenase (short-subunit alcohol dehydrogenase family)
MNTPKLSGQVAVLTGATAGIGKATALLFASQGADLVITGRHAELGEGVAEQARQMGVQAIFIQADHTRQEDCQRVVDETIQHFGHIDILFNNAGVVIQGTAESTSEADWECLMAKR